MYNLGLEQVFIAKIMYEALNENEIIITRFINICECFDTINQVLQMHKFKYYGVITMN